MTHAAASEGNLPGARTHLADAISILIDPKPRRINDATTWIDSLYTQLLDAIPGAKRERTGVARSQPPLWLDASDLLREIDQTITEWEPKYPIQPGDLTEPTPPSVLRLRIIEARTWRPQDVRYINDITAIIHMWADKIDKLLSPQPNWTLAAACPACNTQTVYRRDSSDELIRQPALQIGPTGCICLHCRHVWEPKYFMLLAGALGYDMPEGVLE